MLLRFRLSASSSGQLLYLILRDPLVKSAQFDSKSTPARLLTKRDPLPARWLLANCWGNFSILSHSLCLVKSAARDCFSVSGQHSSQLRGVGTSIVDPRVEALKKGAGRWGVVLRLRGVRLSGLSASLWGEQVISYVASRGWANRARNPGVSPRCFTGIMRFSTPRPLRRQDRGRVPRRQRLARRSRECARWQPDAS
jgi:hypothetical protein